MHISRFQVENFRNLVNQNVPLSPKVNLVTGDNGAGKTSLLEAIYFLGRQRSFRTAKTKELIQQDNNYFRLLAQTSQPDHQIGLERKIDGNQLGLQLRIDRQTQKSPAPLVRIVPTIAITAHSFQLIDAGPAPRRAFMDYGGFHFEPHFLGSWQVYQKALKNRNAALRQKMPPEVIDSFTPSLASAGEHIHSLRCRYFEVFNPLLKHHLQALEFPLQVTVRYTPGWNSDNSLADSLQQQLDNDYRLSHTRLGPHRADMRFGVYHGNAENRLSRGQQKTLILALHLAQIELIGTYGAAMPLLIIDDIAAELDAGKRNHVLDYLQQLDTQMFFSATEPDFFARRLHSQTALIHLQHGKIT